MATLAYQCNLTIFLPVYLYMMEATEKVFFPWLECLEAACFYSGWNIKTEALGRSAGPVQNVDNGFTKCLFLERL